MDLPGFPTYQKKQLSKVWLWNLLLPGAGLGTIYACGSKAVGVLACVWILELLCFRYDMQIFLNVLILSYFALSAWGSIEVARQSQDEELDLARHLPDLDREIDKVSKEYVAAIEGDEPSFALDTLEKKARDAEIRLKSMQAKLNSISESEANQLAALAQLPAELGRVEETASGPDTAASGLMSFAPLFETSEETSGLKLPLGKEPERADKASSSFAPDSKAISFEPESTGAGGQEELPEPWLKLRPREDESGREASASNDDAVRAWLGTAGGDEPAAGENSSQRQENESLGTEPDVVPEVELNVVAEVEPEALPVPAFAPELETPSKITYETPADPELLDAKVAEALEPLYSSMEASQPQPEVPVATEATSLTVAGLDAPFISANTLENLDISTKSDFTPSSSTDYSNFLSESDKKVTDFVDKLATTIGGATAPQPTVDSAFEFSIPNFESSFSFDFSNALADVTDKEASAAAPKGANCCERCGSDRQADFSFCLKCGISFST